MWVISWNEYATQNYLEPDQGRGSDAVGESMVWKTAHYTNRLKSGREFTYYEPLWIDPQYVLRLAGNPSPEELGFSTDPNVIYLDPAQLMIAEARRNALAVEASRMAQGIVAEYLDCTYAADLSRIASLSSDVAGGATALPVDLARPVDAGTVIQVGMGPNRELTQLAQAAEKDTLSLAMPLKQSHQALDPVLVAASPRARTTLPEPPATVRQAAAEVAANLLLRALMREDASTKALSPEHQKALGEGVFSEEIKRAITPFRCRP